MSRFSMYFCGSGRLSLIERFQCLDCSQSQSDLGPECSTRVLIKVKDVVDLVLTVLTSWKPSEE